MKKKERLQKNSVAAKYALIIVNVILILVMIVFSAVYSQNQKQMQEETELSAFCGTVNSMKQISFNYLSTEVSNVKDWAQYINQEEMSIDEALEYVKKCNHQTDRYAHIVDMDTMLAYSLESQNQDRTVSCYQAFKDKGNDETYQMFIDTMWKMFQSEKDELNILGRYRTDDTQINVVSVGTKVTLLDERGKKKDYLLLRLIPIESIRKIWIFPMEFTSAEVGIITRSGAYVVPSKSMKSLSFSEFMWGYNYIDDFNKVDELLDQLANTENGVLKCKDSRGRECYWYYSSFGEDSVFDILGYIPVDNLNIHGTNWTVVIVICGILFLLVAVDGIYFRHMNKKFRETAKQAEEANQAKSQFLSTMSHDIRTPMNGIIGMTNIARKHVDDPAYVKECLRKVSLTSDHLLTLINDILDISKVESGSMTLNPAVFSLEKSIEKLTDIVQIQVEEKKLCFDTKVEITEPYLIADELRLNQIFINILTNAVKYTPQGGSIQMSVREEMLENGNVRLSYQVTDTGMGMSEEFQKDMYHMFARAEDGRIGKIQGTGLGLAIVKQMVDLMKGTIECKSVVNEGTTFKVRIDLKKGSEEEYRKLYGTGETMSDHFENIRVLVAEDNDLNWEISCELLKSLGVTCDRAKDGKECVDILEASKENPYDLVFMDIQMPVMDGKAAARRIRQSSSNYLKHIKIIAMTADAFAEDIQECMEAGMNGHISKPVDARKVIEVLRKVKSEKGSKSL